jgi:hypothetical protein
MQRRKLLVVMAINATIVIYCAYLHFQGYSLGRVASALIFSLIVLNLVAEYSWRRATNKNRQPSGKTQ